ncbi:hypothetical protein [Paenibacillus cymbidii]|uniref:hypothetical protein n=1 Tax=Paenibacillus cymbidii TaxID=1639034 RepID=UPI0010804FCD|nr:hypothetical protein [Paenibacillus cymbidii]
MTSIENIHDIILSDEYDDHHWFQFEKVYLLPDRHVIVLKKEKKPFGFRIVNKHYFQPLNERETSKLQQLYPDTFAGLQKPAAANPAPLFIYAICYNIIETNGIVRAQISFSTRSEPIDASGSLLQCDARYVRVLG